MHPHDLDTTTLPWSPEAESSVLSAMLLSADATDQVLDVLLPSMFFDERNGRVFSTIASMVASCKPVDIFTVLDRMQVTGTDKDIDLGFLNELAQYVPSAANVRRYAEIVVERSLMRGLVAASDKAKELALTAGMPIADRVDQAHDLFQQLQLRRTHRSTKSVSEVAVDLADRLSDLAEGRITPGIPTKLPTLDRLFGGGLKPGKLVVVAARPSIGKTALALAIAKTVAGQDHGVGFMSLEMEATELVDRLVANIGSIDLGHINTGKLNDDEWRGLTMAMEEMARLPFQVDDQAPMTLADIQAKARKLKREKNIKLLVVDYLQLCAASPARSKESRHLQIEEISRGLKVLAKQLGLTVVLLSQLSREVEKRTSGKPTLADLKESGAIEEDADAVILLSLDHVRDNGVVVVHADVAKNRGGQKGFLKLAFTGCYQRYVETIESDQPRRTQARAAYTEDV